MNRILLTAAAGLLAVSAVVVFGGRAAQAYGDKPWCAITSGGFDVHEECEYNSIEECRPHVIAGNRGFCNENPFYRGPVTREPAPRHRRRY